MIAHGRSEEEICSEIGADWLIYQDLDDLISAVEKGNPEVRQFDASVFTGKYVTGDIGDEYLSALQAARNDASKNDRRESDNEVIDLHNTA